MRLNVVEDWWNMVLIHSARITVAAMALTVIVALLYRRQWNRPLFVAFLYVLLTLLINCLQEMFIWTSINHYEMIGPILDRWGIYSTDFLNILYYLKNFLILGWFYSLIFNIRPYNRYILWSGWLLSLAAVINYCFIEGYLTAGVFNPLADAVFIISLPLLYLWFSQRFSLRIPLRKNPYFWISLGLLLPNLLALFLYATGNYLQNHDFILFTKLSIMRNGFDIIGHVFICIGFMHARFARFVTRPVELTTNIGS